MAHDAETSVRQRDPIEAPFVGFDGTAVATVFGAVRRDIRLSGVERSREDPHDFVRVRLLPENVNDLVKIAADHAAWNLTEDRQRDGVDLTDPEVRVHEVDAERRLIQEGDGALGLRPGVSRTSNRSRDRIATGIKA
jgi:hypothetical protein